MRDVLLAEPPAEGGTVVHRLIRTGWTKGFKDLQAKMNESWETVPGAKAGRIGRSLAATFLALAVTMATGCVRIPKPPAGMARAPVRAVPGSFAGLSDTRSSGLIPWRDFFQDAHLAALVDAALEHNQELNIAIQETVVANAEVMARRGEYLPKVGFGAGTGVEHVGAFTSPGQADERSEIGPTLQKHEFGLYASWELDVWGRLRNLANAASHRYLASIEGRNFMVTRLVAEIASSYYELLALDRQLQVVTDNIALQERALDLARAQFQAGRATSAAPARFEATLRAMQSSKYTIQQRIVETENQINFLAGRFPKPIDRSRTNFLDLQPAAMAVGVPAELLANRPDVRQAELELAAAGLDVEAARKAFYPSLGIEAVVGYQSYGLTKLVNTPDSLLFEVLGKAFKPLLNRKGITADYFSANSREMQAVLHYERAVLIAFVEVSNRVSLTRNLSQGYGLKQQQVGRLAQSVDISTELFNLNRTEYLEVLTARRELLEAQQELVELKQRQMVATVTLYQALGGGWRGAGLQPSDGSDADHKFTQGVKN
ncbi:MAG: efflux transporter outer membrane subunit [Bryobacterales bacterium]|nr:efflux transporter outer membrane subunit [Bryobacterales bacterium]